MVRGKAVTRFESDKGRALLAYLAVNGERPFKRETLAALFWPDLSAKDGRNNLRQALFKLKRLLGDSKRPFFITTRTTIQFNRQPDDWLDIEAIITADADELLRLYTAPFLDQLYLDDCQEFEEWTLIQREWIHQQTMRRFYDMAEKALSDGAYENASQLAARQITLDRWRESAWRQSMRVLAAQNKYSSALAQYESCRVVLADELGIEPAQETMALYREIQVKMQMPPAPVPRYTLPVSPTPFIGRAAEIETINGRLSTPSCRLLTLTGPGGIGKTRLALHIAAAMTETFRDGIFFVPLAPITPAADPAEQIIHAIATAVNLTFSGPTPPRRQLAGWLQGKNILLLIDNVEHMADGAGAIGYLLQTTLADAHAPFKILATSRQRLNLAEEWVNPVYGMAYPAADDTDIEQFDAMKLFWQRARMVNPDFSFSVMAKPFAAQICRMAGGYPLAITLAASWTRVISCAEIAAEMKHDLKILQTRSSNMEARHQDLYAVLHQSWKKLSTAAQTALLKLALFPDGFTRRAGTAVAQSTLFVLQELIDYAFLSRDGERYRIHELLRQFAAEMLAERGGDAAAKREIMGYYGRFLQEKTAFFHDERRRAALRAVGEEQENIRTCWRWACDAGNIDFLRDGMEAVYQFYEIRSLFPEGAALFTMGAVLMADVYHFQARLGVFHYRSGQLEQSETLLMGALAAAETAVDDKEIGFCTAHLGGLLYWRGDHDNAFPYAQRALTIARRTGDIPLLALATNSLTLHHTRTGEWEKATAYGHESLIAYQRLGVPLNKVVAMTNIAIIALQQGEYDEAEQLLRECLEISAREKAGYAEMMVLLNLALVTNGQHRYEEAEAMMKRGLAISRAIGHRPGEAGILNNLGCLYYDMALYDLAFITLQSVLPIQREVNNLWGTAATTIHIGEVLAAQNKLEEAESTLQEGVALAREVGGQTAVYDGLAALAELRAKQGDGETAVLLAQQVLDSKEATDRAREKAQAVLDALNPNAAPPKPIAV